MDRICTVARTARVTLRRLAIAFYRFWGPVADSVRGRVNMDEAVRVVAKSGVVFAGTEVASIKKLLTDPDVQSAIVIPVIAGVLAGLLEYFHRKQQGGEAVKDTKRESPTLS
jgi:hypothetical protein